MIDKMSQYWRLDAHSTLIEICIGHQYSNNNAMWQLNFIFFSSDAPKGPLDQLCSISCVDGHFRCFKFVWTERVQVIIDSANFDMICYLSLLQELNLHLSVSKDSIFHVEIEDFKFKDSKQLLIDTLSPERMQFISQIIKIAHKVQNHLYYIYFIISLL